MNPATNDSIDPDAPIPGPRAPRRGAGSEARAVDIRDCRVGEGLDQGVAVVAVRRSRSARFTRPDRASTRVFRGVLWTVFGAFLLTQTPATSERWLIGAAGILLYGVTLTLGALVSTESR